MADMLDTVVLPSCRQRRTAPPRSRLGGRRPDAEGGGACDIGPGRPALPGHAHADVGDRLGGWAPSCPGPWRSRKPGGCRALWLIDGDRYEGAESGPGGLRGLREQGGAKAREPSRAAGAPCGRSRSTRRNVARLVGEGDIVFACVDTASRRLIGNAAAPRRRAHLRRQRWHRGRSDGTCGNAQIFVRARATDQPWRGTSGGGVPYPPAGSAGCDARRRRRPSSSSPTSPWGGHARAVPCKHEEVTWTSRRVAWSPAAGGVRQTAIAGHASADRHVREAGQTPAGMKLRA